MQVPDVQSLTPREKEILTLIAEGYSLPEIAQHIHRSLKTIESHRLSLGRKLNASNRVELVKIAIAAGMISVDAIGEANEQQTPTPPGTPPSMAETELAWLERVNSAVEMAVGGEYLREFCAAMSLLPGVRAAAICTPDPKQSGEMDPYLRCLFAGADKGVLLESAPFDARETPCQTTIEEGIVQIPQGVLQSYPQSELLRLIEAESYLGIQLRDEQGRDVGASVIVGDEPIADMSSYRRVLKFFAPRVAAELIQHRRIEQLRAEQQQTREKLRLREQQLHAMLDQREPSPSALPRIAARVDHLVGDTFLRALTDAICDVCGVQIASVCMPSPVDDEPGFYTLAISEDGKQTDPLRIKRAASACSLFEEEHLIVCDRDMPSRLPHCTMAVEGDYQAYIGARLDLESDASGFGGLWVLSKEPIEDTTTIQAVLMHFAARAAAEVDQITYIQKLQDAQQRLQTKAHQLRAHMHADSSVPPRSTSESALAFIQSRTSSVAGPGFFRGITEALCDALDVRFAGVCLSETVDGQPGFNAISVSEHGRQVDTVRYPIEGSPCQETLEQNFYCCQAGLKNQFPDDPSLAGLDAQSYAGVCLETNASGRIGVLWVIDTKPIQDPQTIDRVFRHFAPRISTELEQFIKLEDLHAIREQLELAINKN